MDTISEYRQIRLLLGETRRGVTAHLHARVVHRGRTRDTSIGHGVLLEGMHLGTRAEVYDVLARAVEELAAQIAP